MHLSGLYLYPVKSLRGQPLTRATVEPRGLTGDRRWMVVDAKYRFLTQRQHPTMARLVVQPTGDGLILSTEQSPALTVQRPAPAAGTRPAIIWKDIVDVQDAGDEPARWLSDALGQTCRLVYLPDTSLRPVDPAYRRRPDDQVSLADGYPLLLISDASLADLNGRLPHPVPMNRFRPNLTVQDCDAFEEDGWQRIRVGMVEFHVVKPCARCSITTVDQASGIQGKEPLRTLSTYRRAENGNVYFGQNLIPVAPGTVHLGDPVTVLA